MGKADENVSGLIGQGEAPSMSAWLRASSLSGDNAAAAQVTRIFTSPVVRATRQTADVLAQHLQVDVAEWQICARSNTAWEEFSDIRQHPSPAGV
jgi:phosphohistidine phosphatase SixA